MGTLDCISYHGYRITVLADDDDSIGYQILDADHIAVTDCYGLHDLDALLAPDGWALQECRNIIDYDIAAVRNAATA